MYDTNILLENGVNLKQSLELFGDMETYNDNLDEFLKNVSEKVQKLTGFKEHADMANYAILVHSIKSDAKYFGFDKLAEIAFKHEQESKNNNMYYIYDNYDELIKEINRITDLIHKYLGMEKEEKVQEVSNVNKEDKTILVVDDSNVISNFISKVFDNSCEIFVAKDGQEAIDYLVSKGSEIEGMLLDLNMPNVNGYDVLDYMEKNSLFNTIKVAIISGIDANKIQETTKNYPIKAILEKPFNEANVRRVVELITKRD